MNRAGFFWMQWMNSSSRTASWTVLFCVFREKLPVIFTVLGCLFRAAPATGVQVWI